MDEFWKYSKSVEKDIAQASGCFTTLPIRIHQRDDIANEATLRSVAEWGEHVGDGMDKKSGSALSPVGNWCSFIFPESLPERLGVITYLANIGNIHDDACEEMDLSTAIAAHEELSNAMDISKANINDGNVKSLKLKRLLSQCLLECISHDRQLGLRMLESYRKKWLDVMEHPDIEKVQTMDEYLTFRNLNGGMEPFWLMCQFGMGISLTAAEARLVRHIFVPAEAALVLTNDYWSWNREYELSKKSNAPRIVNSIDLLMRTQCLGIPEAREIIKGSITKYESDYARLRSELYQAHPDIPFHLRLYVEVCGAVVAGNHYWCANCPRHNSWHQNLGNIQEESLLISEEPASGSSKKRKFSESDIASTVSSSQDREAMSVQTSVTTISDGDWCGPDNTVKWIKPCNSAIVSPVNYINSLPSKSVRLVLIEALNQWLQVPSDSLHTIETIVNQLHNASLILDDIEDNSPLRRGSPAVHTIFGPAQSINSANVMYVHAVKRARKLRNPRAADILLDELECLYLGQSWDLYWKFNLSCPNIGEYLNMVDNKTGVMFRMLLSLMQGEISGERNIDFSRLALLFGRFFQIRDDYMNLQSKDYSEQKGFCEDLDEGKFSYPIVRCMENHPDLGARILGIFRQRTMGLDKGLQCLSHRVKLYIVNSMKAVGCFVETLDCLKALEAELEEEIECLEKHIGTTNPMLRLLLATLTVKDLSA